MPLATDHKQQLTMEGQGGASEGKGEGKGACKADVQASPPEKGGDMGVCGGHGRRFLWDVWK